MRKNYFKTLLGLSFCALLAFSSCREVAEEGGTKRPDNQAPARLELTIPANIQLSLNGDNGPKSRHAAGTVALTQMLTNPNLGAINWIANPHKDGYGRPEIDYHLKFCFKNEGSEDAYTAEINSGDFKISGEEKVIVDSVWATDANNNQLKDKNGRPYKIGKVRRDSLGHPVMAYKTARIKVDNLLIYGPRGKHLDFNKKIYVAAIIERNNYTPENSKPYSMNFKTNNNPVQAPNYYNPNGVLNKDNYYTLYGAGNRPRPRIIPVTSSWQPVTVGEDNNKKALYFRLKMRPRGCLIGFKLYNNGDLPLGVKGFTLSTGQLSSDVTFNFDGVPVANKDIDFTDNDNTNSHSFAINPRSMTTRKHGDESYTSYLWFMPKKVKHGNAMTASYDLFSYDNDRTFVTQDIQSDPSFNSGNTGTILKDGYSYILPTIVYGQHKDLMITEVLHWNEPVNYRSYNRTIVEVYNPTDKAIDLSDYAFARCRMEADDSPSDGKKPYLDVINPGFHPIEDYNQTQNKQGITNALDGAVAQRLYQDIRYASLTNIEGYGEQNWKNVYIFNYADKYANGTPAIGSEHQGYTLRLKEIKGKYTKMLQPGQTALYGAGGWIRIYNDGRENEEGIINPFPGKTSFWKNINDATGNYIPGKTYTKCAFFVACDDGATFSDWQHSRNGGVLQMGTKHGLLLLKYKPNSKTDYEIVDEFAPIANGHAAFEKFQTSDVATEAGWTAQDYIDWVRASDVLFPSLIWSYGYPYQPKVQWYKNGTDAAPFSLGTPTPSKDDQNH